MEIVKKLITFKNEDMNEVRYYQVYIKTDDNHLIPIKACYKTDIIILKFLATPID